MSTIDESDRDRTTDVRGRPMTKCHDPTSFLSLKRYQKAKKQRKRREQVKKWCRMGLIVAPESQWQIDN